MRPKTLLVALAAIFCTSMAMAANPVISHPFTADPSIHRWSDGKFYIYGSHDKDNPGKWNMSDYHVFSSDDMVTWKDHGVVLDNKQTPWGGPFWAPDAVEKNGHYYLYFPEGEHICVADSPSPTGPFNNPKSIYKKPEGYLQSYDPAYFEWEGESYIVISEHADRKTPFYPVILKLKPNMTEIDESATVKLPGMQGFHEGPFIFFREGKTYMIGGGGKTLRYFMADSPFGPYKPMGNFFFGTDTHTISKTAHGSAIEVDGQWYVAGHYDVFPGNPYCRTTVIEYMYFNEDGTIKPIYITQEGIKPVTPKK